MGINVQENIPAPPQKKNKPKYSATVKIQNVVVSVNFKHEILLDDVVNHYKDIEYNPERFPGICIRLTPPSPKSTILLFKNGKAIITGLKNTHDVPKVISKIIQKLERIGIKISPDPEYSISNVVSSINFKRKINLDLASLALNSAIYEPEIFPGLIYRQFDPKAVFLLFTTGKAILTGINNEDLIVPMVKKMGNDLKKHNLFV